MPNGIQDLFAQPFVGKLNMLAIAWSVTSHLISSRAGGLESDERHLRVRHRAVRVGDWPFTLIVIAPICVLALTPAPLRAKSPVEHASLALAYRA